MKEIKQHIWVDLHLQLKPVKIDIGEQAHVTALNSEKYTIRQYIGVNPKV
jgi:hypothetical protein